MKRFLLPLFLFLALTGVCLAEGKGIESPVDCRRCGMDRTIFDRSRMVVTYSDGSSGTCSINCAVVDMQANREKTVTSLQVGDYDTRKLIDARTAVWAMGGKKRGVMTAVPKWAFADKRRAAKFIKVNGGSLATFDEVVKATEKELEELEKEKRQSLE
jgi:copper chaperone NosL